MSTSGLPLRKLRRRRILRLLLVTLALIMVGPVISYTRALTAPGGATWPMRSVEWVRGNGGNSLVNAIENWWHTRHTPAAGRTDAATLPQIGSTAVEVVGPAPLQADQRGSFYIAAA